MVCLWLHHGVSLYAQWSVSSHGLCCTIVYLCMLSGVSAAVVCAAWELGDFAKQAYAAHVHEGHMHGKHVHHARGA